MVSLIPSSLSVVWSSVKRAGNRVAHGLAHFQPLKVGKRYWEDEILNSIVKLALDDLIQLFPFGVLLKKIILRVRSIHLKKFAYLN